jgi:division protein CdvB (Snf7/Vps24/ESCRT-III family)
LGQLSAVQGTGQIVQLGVGKYLETLKKTAILKLDLDNMRSKLAEYIIRLQK